MKKKLDEAVLALLYLTTFKDKPYWRAWTGHNWDSLDRLHQKGYISDPATKAKSVFLTEEGAKRSQDLFEKYFTKSTYDPSRASMHRCNRSHTDFVPR
jgi:hypothetical protein